MVTTIITVAEAIAIIHLIREVNYQKSGLKTFNEGLNKFAELFKKEVDKSNNLKDKNSIHEIEIDELTRQVELLKEENNNLSETLTDVKTQIKDLDLIVKAVINNIEAQNTNNVITNNMLNKEVEKQFNLFNEWITGEESTE